MEEERKEYLERALKAADWFVNNQLAPEYPWMADWHRYCYYYYMPEKKYVPGLNWTHGRGIFTTTEAYNITGDKKYLESAQKAGRYLMALQPLDPYYETTYGVFREEIPQASRGGILDGAQAASGMLMLYQVTGKYDYLRRGKAFCDFILKTWREDAGMASFCDFYPEKITYPNVPPSGTIHQASAIPLWHLMSITGDGSYMPVIRDAANRVLQAQRDDGALNYISDITGADEPEFNHIKGLGQGDEKFILRNDDGVVVVVLAAYRITGDKKYLDALVDYADWIVENEPHERPFCAFGIQANNVLDIGKEADIDYSDWVLDNLQKHCLDLQVKDTGDPMADGGFCGEDEEGDSGIFGGNAKDYVPTRNTCYMAGLLFRLSGKGTGAGFSANGLRTENNGPNGPESFFQKQL